MYKASTKLPQWQHTPNRRPSVSRRSRYLIIIALCYLGWHQYFHKSNQPTQRELDHELARSYPQPREDLVKHPRMETREAFDVVEADAVHGRQQKYLQDKKSPRTSGEELVVQPVAYARGESPKVLDEKTMLDPNVLLEEQAGASAEKVPLGLSTDIEQVKREPEDNEAPEKKSKTKNSSDDSEKVIENTPPALVMEAAQKLIDQHLSPATRSKGEKEVKTLSEDPNLPQQFPPYLDYATLSEKAEGLPDIIHVPFEVSTAEVTLQGWEDEWFADANFVGENLTEPKIDFLYTCE